MEPVAVFPPPPEVAEALRLLASRQVAAAVPLLERAAAFLIQEQLERRLSHLEDLGELGLEGLAERYQQRAEMFQGLGSSLGSGQEPVLGELNEITKAIRSVQGYQRFLLPLDLGQILALGYPDPVAYLVSGDETGWALLLQPGPRPTLTAIPLPGLTRAEVDRRALTSWFSSASEPDYALAVARTDEIATWCWDACMARVCAALPADSRVTLIPIGPVSLFPLHIAFTPSADAPCGRRYALDHLVISYAPSLRVAAFTRRPPGPPAQPRVSAFAPTPGTGPEDTSALPFSAPEASYVSALYAPPPGPPAPGAAGAPAPGPRAPGASGPVIGADATPEALLASLRQPGYVHFAGHARVSPSMSGASFLRFGGQQRLLLNDLRRLWPAEAELVVLSACASTLSTATHPEQALTIGNVLLGCGVRGVVATMWRIIDDASALLACRFHELARETPDRIPEALRAAQQWLRDASPQQRQDKAKAIGIELETDDPWWSSPVAWGGFIHCGSAGTRGLTGPRPLPRPRVRGFDPRELAGYYGFPAGYDGSGVSVAVVDLFGDVQEQDLDAYFAANPGARPTVERILVSADRGPADAASSAGLTALLQTLGALAPGARLAVYLAANHEMGLTDALARAIYDDQPGNAIICLTMAEPEDIQSESLTDLVGHLVETATAMGKTVCAPGLTNAPGGNGGHRIPAFPGSHPLVLGCAATRAVAVAGPAAAAPGPAAAGSGIWIEHPGLPAGSVSRRYPRPDWQPVSSFAPGGASVPDVAALADEHGYRCLVDGTWRAMGGDAFAVAVWAGLLARLTQALGRPWGMVPDLYTKVGPAGVLTGLPHGVAPPGWQPGLGWGVPDGDRLLAALRGPAGGRIS